MRGTVNEHRTTDSGDGCWLDIGSAQLSAAGLQENFVYFRLLHRFLCSITGFGRRYLHVGNRQYMKPAR